MKRFILFLMLLFVLTGCQVTASPTVINNRAEIAEANTAYQFGDLVMAEGKLQQLIYQGRADTRVWSLLGNVYFRQQRFNAAARAYEKALQLSPEHRVATRNLASAHLRIATQLLIDAQQPRDPTDPLLAWLLALHSQAEGVQ